MRVLVLFFIFLVTSCSVFNNRYPASRSQVIDIVFDLDWTLFSQVKSAPDGDSRFIRLGDEIYRANDYARELLTYLIQRKDVRVSFYSGGPESRNLKLLNKVKLLDGSNRSFLDVAHKVVSRDQMIEVDVSNMNNPAMADRWRKDLLKIKGTLENLLMIEDDVRHALNAKQREHIAWLGKSFYHYEEYTQVVPKKGDQFIPADKLQWIFQRNKLGVLAGIIDESLENGGDFNSEVRKRLEKTNFKSNLFNSHAGSYLEKGKAVLGKVNKSVQKVPLDKDCFTSVSLLLHSI